MHFSELRERLFHNLKSENCKHRCHRHMSYKWHVNMYQGETADVHTFSLFAAFVCTTDLEPLIDDLIKQRLLALSHEIFRHCYLFSLPLRWAVFCPLLPHNLALKVYFLAVRVSFLTCKSDVRHLVVYTLIYPTRGPK